MAAKTGRLLVVKQNTSGTTYAVVGAARSDSITINNETVDITNKTSVNSGKAYRELLEKGGVQSVTLEVEVVHNDSTLDKLMQDRALAMTHHTYRVEVPGDSTAAGGYFSGTFVITSAPVSGGHNAEAIRTYTLESAGEVTFTSSTVS